MDICMKTVTKIYGEKTVLDNLSLCFKEKEITCIMAPSGFGKTTLLRCMMGIEAIDKGVIEGMPDRFSVVFQEDRLCERFATLSNVYMICEGDVTKKMAAEHLTEVGLADSVAIPVSQLSGGMKRRVAIVRAVMARGDLIILDEPFKGMDTDTKDMMIGYIKSHRAERTVLVVTHDIQEVERFGGNLEVL